MSDSPEGPAGCLDQSPKNVASSIHPALSDEHPARVTLCVPWLHPEMGSPGLPDHVLFLEPGIRSSPSCRDWRPENLPLDETMVARFLRESTVFSQEHSARGAPVHVAVRPDQRSPSETPLAIMSELTGGVRRGDDPAIRSQQLLLLAWQLEEQVLEIRSLHRHVRDGWEQLGEVLGVAGPEDFRDLHVQAIPDTAEGPLEHEALPPWRAVLEAILFFVPQEIILATTHRDIIDALSDLSDCDAPALQMDIDRAALCGLRRTCRIIRAPGWKLVQSRRCPADKPWLVEDRLLALLPANDAADGAVR